MSGQAPKRYASRLFQFKIGHGAVGFFLERIWVTETTECCTSPVCMYTKGKKWCRGRRVLKEELRAFGIGWQRRPEKRLVAKSTGERASGTTATEYLMTTEVGGREGGAEGAVEWEQATRRPRRGGITRSSYRRI